MAAGLPGMRPPVRDDALRLVPQHRQLLLGQQYVRYLAHALGPAVLLILLIALCTDSQGGWCWRLWERVGGPLEVRQGSKTRACNRQQAANSRASVRAAPRGHTAPSLPA